MQDTLHRIYKQLVSPGACVLSSLIRVRFRLYPSSALASRYRTRRVPRAMCCQSSSLPEPLSVFVHFLSCHGKMAGLWIQGRCTSRQGNGLFGLWNANGWFPILVSWVCSSIVVYFGVALAVWKAISPREALVFYFYGCVTYQTHFLCPHQSLIGSYPFFSIVVHNGK